jgi:GGDEF domain-containing protein
MAAVKDGSTTVRKALEVLLFSVAVAVLNWFFPDNPGFLEGWFNPYVFLSLLIAVSYGKYYGFLCLCYTVGEVGLGLPLARSVAAGAGLSVPTGAWSALGSAAPLSLGAAVLEVYLLGIIRDSLTRGDRAARQRLAAISREKGLLKRQVRALTEANQELEERISRQEDSVTSLYSQVQVLSSSGLGKAMGALLSMTERFVGATRCSIWQHRPEEGKLAFVSGIGWDPGGESATLLPDEGTIEGWVVRNNTTFSVKMLLDNDALARMDQGRAILAMPIIAGRRTWGVLCVEEMPFARYNLYSERLLQVIMALAGPALERAIEFESLVRQEDVNPVTGLHSFPELYAMLGMELARLDVENGTLALVVLEIANFAGIAERHGREQALLVLRDLALAAEEAAGAQARVFHHKADSQLAVLCPQLDADGASLLALTLLGTAGGSEWKARGEPVRLEVILGFGARTGPGQTAEDLITAAENLLEMQKV